jgi:predicted HTH transcriptional regulator
MTEDQLRKIFAEGEPSWLEGYAATDLKVEDVSNLLLLESYFKLSALPRPSDLAAAIDRLRIDGLVHESGGKYSIPRSSALMLATDMDAFPELERKKTRVVVYNGTSKLNTKLERTAVRGYAVGFQGLVKFIGEQLPQNEVIENAVRKETKLVPESVIRELIANAHIHQDFEIPGTSVMIEIYSDRVEISNPGVPKIPTDRFIDGCQSRNERFAMMMRKLKICEEKGSGIDRVVEAAEILQLPAPDFRTGFQSTTTVIYGPRDFDEMGRDDRVRACYQHCVLRYVMSKQMTNQSLRERFNLPENKSSIVSQIIAFAAESGFIKPDGKAGGSRKFARYIPIWA